MTAEPRALRTDAETALAAAFEAAGASLPGNPAVRARREAAMAEFRRVGLPHRRVEAWKYTDLRAQMRRFAPLASGSDEAVLARLVAADPFAAIDRIRLVIADGRFRPDLSDLADAPGLAVRPLADALAAGDPSIGALFADTLDPLLALNTAFAADGVVIAIAAGAEISRPIEIVHLTTGAESASTFTRNVVHVGAGAALKLIETHLGVDGVGHQGNVATELKIGDRAKVKAARLDGTGDAAMLIASLVADMGAEAEFDHGALAAGGALSRAQSFVTISGPRARLGMSGATLLGGKRHADSKLTIEHAKPGATSRVTFKNAVGGSASGAFQGLIIVDQDSQKTDGRMMTRTLLLSDDASFAQKPELEIYADDVQCGHGATSGRLDEDALFYFLSRGIPRPEAERLLLRAFLAEGIEGAADPHIVGVLEPIIERWLGVRG